MQKRVTKAKILVVSTQCGPVFARLLPPKIKITAANAPLYVPRERRKALLKSFVAYTLVSADIDMPILTFSSGTASKQLRQRARKRTSRKPKPRTQPKRDAIAASFFAKK
jgi:hypothetical protein